MKTTLFAALAATLALPAFADIKISDAYARTSGPAAKTAAAFMLIENDGATDDRLIAVRSTISEAVELHTHLIEDGIARMREAEDGFTIPAGGTHALERGGNHVMFMGLTRPLKTDDDIALTLVFENAGDVELNIKVDNTQNMTGGAARADEEDPEAHAH